VKLVLLPLRTAAQNTKPSRSEDPCKNTQLQRARFSSVALSSLDRKDHFKRTCQNDQVNTPNIILVDWTVTVHLIHTGKEEDW